MKVLPSQTHAGENNQSVLEADSSREGSLWGLPQGAGSLGLAAQLVN